MKAIMLMFDSLNRRFLPNFGCEWTKMPNFKRLGEKTLTFDNFYGGSMPCMPARRELHTGRYNFLHRYWTPMEPFDESVISNLKNAGVYTHIVTDHFHYWEDGGSGYLTKFDSHEMIRGQQGDPWIGQVERPYFPDTLAQRKYGENWRHDWINRGFIDTEEKMPQARTFERGIDFIDRNSKDDNWFLQIEAFDPHEPFFTQDAYKELYNDAYDGKNLDWPDYGYNSYDEAAIEHVRKEYAALLSMCDHYLGKLLDKMDALDMWRDTMLIVNTDHGFLLGERELIGKNLMPWYNDLINVPFFLYDPRFPNKKNEHRTALAQTVDIAPTLADFFGAAALEFADGVSLVNAIEKDEKVRDTALFGMFGGHINITDGRYVYMHAPISPRNLPLYEYTLIANHMNCQFSPNELHEMEIAEFKFTRGAKVMKIPSKSFISSYWSGNLLFDLKEDTQQEHTIENEAKRLELLTKMRDMMTANEAPSEQFLRMGIPQEGVITPQTLAPLAYSGTDFEVSAPLNLTPRAKKALNIFLCLQNEEMQTQIVEQVKALTQKVQGPLDEEAIIVVIGKALPQGMANMMQSMIRTYLI